ERGAGGGGDPQGGLGAPGLAPRRPARDRGHRPRVGERDPARRKTLPVPALDRALSRSGGAPHRRDQQRARPRPRAAGARRLRRAHVPRPPPARRALPRLRDAARPGRLRGAHDLLLPRLPDRRPGFEGPAPFASAPVALLSGPWTPWRT